MTVARRWGATEDFELLSRILSGLWTDFWLVKRNATIPHGHVIDLVILPDDSLHFVNYAGPFTGNFPYGFEVDPD